LTLPDTKVSASTLDASEVSVRKPFFSEEKYQRLLSPRPRQVIGITPNVTQPGHKSLLLLFFRKEGLAYLAFL
jgi:hypothetical protein